MRRWQNEISRARDERGVSIWAMLYASRRKRRSVAEADFVTERYIAAYSEKYT